MLWLNSARVTREVGRYGLTNFLCVAWNAPLSDRWAWLIQTRGFVLELFSWTYPVWVKRGTDCFSFVLRLFLFFTMAPSPGIHRKTFTTFVFGLSAGFLCTYFAITNHSSSKIEMAKLKAKHYIAVPTDPHSHGEMENFTGPEEAVSWHDQESHHGEFLLMTLFNGLWFLAYYNGKQKVEVYVYCPDVPVGSSDFTLISPRYWNSLFHNLISLGRMQRNFLQLYPFTQYQ